MAGDKTRNQYDADGSADQMSDKITDRVIYSGRVQGVGFRYAVHSMARRRPVTGFVRNLADGTVELLVQGKKGDVEALLAEVAAHFRNNILACERFPTAGPDSFEGFEIRF